VYIYRPMNMFFGSQARSKVKTLSAQLEERKKQLAASDRLPDGVA